MSLELIFSSPETVFVFFFFKASKANQLHSPYNYHCPRPLPRLLHNQTPHVPPSPLPSESLCDCDSLACQGLSQAYVTAAMGSLAMSGGDHPVPESYPEGLP